MHLTEQLAHLSLSSNERSVTTFWRTIRIFLDKNRERYLTENLMVYCTNYIKHQFEVMKHLVSMTRIKIPT